MIKIKINNIKLNYYNKIKMKKNKSLSKNNYPQNRQNLINKISDALSLKYNNFFTAAKYDNKALKEDVSKLLTTQYYSKDPRDVFKPIETNILDMVKQKNPQLQVKIKKARKLPEIKYTKDKYQEADEPEIPKEKEKEEKKLPRSVTEKPKNQNQNNKLPRKSNNKINNTKVNKTENKVDNNVQLTDINSKKETNTNNAKKEVVSNTMYKIQQEYGAKHTLVDQLNNRIKYDPTIKILEEEEKLYKKEQEERKQKKLIDQKNYLNDLKAQIEEKDKLKEQERQFKIKELEEMQQQAIYDKEKQKQKELDDQQKREKIKQHYEQLIQEKDDLKRKKKLEEEKENKLFEEMVNKEVAEQKKKLIDKKNKIREEIIKTREINAKLAQEKINTEKLNDEKNEDEEHALFKPNSISNNVVKERINRRAKEQEAAGNYLLKIYNSLEKQNQDAYIAEREKQDHKKQLEYEIADKKRQIKMIEYQKSLLATLAQKSLEKEKEKEEEEKYRKSLEDEYARYLVEEKERKQKQFEKYENYRKALEEQIKENKIRELEKMKYK